MASSNGQHDIDHAVQQCVDLSLIVPTPLHPEGDGSHLLDAQALTALQVGRDPSRHDVDLIDSIAESEEPDAPKASLRIAREAIENLLSEDFGFVDPLARTDGLHRMLPLTRGERVLHAGKRRVDGGHVVSTTHEREPGLTDRSGVHRVVRTIERRTCAIKERIDGGSVVASRPSARATKRPCTVRRIRLGRGL